MSSSKEIAPCMTQGRPVPRACLLFLETSTSHPAVIQEKMANLKFIRLLFVQAMFCNRSNSPLLTHSCHTLSMLIHTILLLPLSLEMITLSELDRSGHSQA